MNKYELRIITATGVLLMSFLFAVLYAAYDRKFDVPACIPYNAGFKEPRVKQVDDSTYEAYCVAKMWSFEPAQIELPVGASVDFYLTSNDVVHGFDIPMKGINMMAIYGAVNKTTVKFDKPGVYKIYCHEYCGIGHHNMSGEVIVNYK